MIGNLGPVVNKTSFVVDREMVKVNGEVVYVKWISDGPGPNEAEGRGNTDSGTS